MNYNLINKVFVGLCLSIVCFGSCEKNNLVQEQGIVPPSYARFNTKLLADSIATYYIRSDNAPYKLPIGVTTVSNVDRTIMFEYTSNTAVKGVQYNAPSTLIIPAGKTIDSLVFSGLYSGYTSSARKDTVKITITDGGDIPGTKYITPRKNVYYLILRKYCDVLLSDLYGNYTRAIDNGNYGPYPMAVVPGSAVSTGATTGTLQLTNIWDPGVPVTTTVNLDWTNPADFKVTITDQVYFAPANLWIKNSATTGTFSSCDQTFTLKYTLYNKITGANYSANQTTIMSR